MSLLNGENCKPRGEIGGRQRSLETGDFNVEGANCLWEASFIICGTLKIQKESPPRELETVSVCCNSTCMAGRGWVAGLFDLTIGNHVIRSKHYTTS